MSGVEVCRVRCKVDDWQNPEADPLARDTLDPLAEQGWMVTGTVVDRFGAETVATFHLERLTR